MVSDRFSLGEFIIGDKIFPRPGNSGNHFIADYRYREFWEHLNSAIRSRINTFQPLGKENCYKINPFFGYFGFRFHPITFQSQYFHAGIDFDVPKGQHAYAFADGFFEYSGFGKENGKYIMISHPQLNTGDDFKLYSLYMHLSTFNIRFNFFEKISREIGIKVLAEKRIKSGQLLGKTGDSGNSVGVFPHLHFQLEFRSEESNKVILLDPAPILGYAPSVNATREIKNFVEFKKFYEHNEPQLRNWQTLINNYGYNDQTP